MSEFYEEDERPDSVAAAFDAGEKHVTTAQGRGVNARLDIDDLADREAVVRLVAEVVRLRDESARAYSQGVEDMRAAAMKAASDAPGTPYTPTEAIRDVILTGPTDPAPDTCTSQSTFPISGTLTCELPVGHSDIHRCGEGMWTDDGADKAPAPASIDRDEGEAAHVARLWGQPAPRGSDLASRVDALEELTASLADALEAQSRDIPAIRADVSEAAAAARGVGKLLREHITAHASHATDVEQRMQAVESAVLPPR